MWALSRSKREEGGREATDVQQFFRCVTKIGKGNNYIFSILLIFFNYRTPPPLQAPPFCFGTKSLSSLLLKI